LKYKNHRTRGPRHSRQNRKTRPQIKSKRSVNVEVFLDESGGSFDRMLRKFIKKVKKEGIIEKYRDRMYYEKPSTKRRKDRIKKRQNAQRLEAERREKHKIKYD